MSEITRIEQLNAEIGDWTARQAQKLQQEVRRLTLSERRILARSIRARLKLKEGMVERVNIGFDRHGIFLERGVFGVRGHKGTRHRPPKEWIKPVLGPGIEELADLLANGYADLAAGEIKIVIPGVLDRRVVL